MSAQPPGAELRHTLTFDCEVDAAGAARALRERHFDIEGQRRVSGWRLLARAQPQRYDEIGAVRVLDWAAAEFGGRYDGSHVTDGPPAG